MLDYGVWGVVFMCFMLFVFLNEVDFFSENDTNCVSVDIFCFDVQV